MIKHVLVLLTALSIAACNQSPRDIGPKYEPVRSNANRRQQLRLAVHPLYNPAKLGQVYNPLIDYLNNSIPGIAFALEASRDYASYEEKIRQGAPDILIPNPWQTLEAMKMGYEVIAMVGEPEDFIGLIIVRKDGGIGKPSDLKGKTVSFPAPTAIAACMMPQMFLHEQGVDVVRDIKSKYVGSQESSIMNVYLKQAAAGGTWPPPWQAFQKDHPREARELKVIWKTPPLVNLSVMTRKNMPDALKQRIRTALLSLHTTGDGKKMLAAMGAARIHAASDGDYEVVRGFMRHFEKEVRVVTLK